MNKQPPPLDSASACDAALAEIATYFEHEPKPGAPAADRFDTLARMIEDYERLNWPLEPPDPVAATR